MASTYHYPDHARAALLRRLAQDYGKPKLEALISVLSSRYQYLEDALWEVHEHSYLDNATGYDLDRLGAIVGEPRLGRDDDTYRLWCRARSLANRSAGRVDDLLRIVRLLVEPGATIQYTDLSVRDAEAYFGVFGTTAAMDQIARILEDVVPAGVSLYVATSAVPYGELFVFDGTAAQGFDVGVWAGLV